MLCFMVSTAYERDSSLQQNALRTGVVVPQRDTESEIAKESVP